MTNSSSYLIVGAGVFGTSTAYHLKRTHPSATVTLVDRDAYNAATRVAASWDWNKVVRADYRDKVYCHLALEAQGLWRNDPVWKPYYHESGVFWISPTGFAEEVIENFRREGVDPAVLASYDVETAKNMYGGLFEDALFDGVKKVLVNNSSGWAAAKEALQGGAEECIRLGVNFCQIEIESLLFEGESIERRCSGIRSTSGEEIYANKVILCTGSYTPTLLIKSAAHHPELHAGSRIISAGVTEGVAPVKAAQWPRFRDMPVAIQEIPIERGG
jgi:glycine/D-amino acid oxidase-like deaminating enzyme